MNFKLAAIIPAVLSLAVMGCSQEVLEFRNAEISNGKIYREGEDLPFSGRVENIPYTQLAPRSLTTAIHRALGGYTSLENAHYGRDQRKDIREYPNTNKLLCSASFEDGTPHGDVACASEGASGTQLEFAFTDDGNFDLTAYSSVRAGVPVIQAHFVGDRLHGDFEVLSSKSGDVLYTAPYEGGRINGTVIAHHAVTGVLVDETEMVNSAKHGEYRRYADDGSTLWQRISFANGQLDGPYEIYAANGDVVSKGTVVNGTDYPEPIGAAGQASASAGAAVDTEACVDGWVSAHRAAVGEDAMIRMDMVEEWESWCKDGRQPPAA